MRVAVVIILVVCAYNVYSERCTGIDATKCVGTSCASTLAHSHIRCVEGHCTCSDDPVPCLLINECSHNRCIDHNGDETKFHCLDGNCTCVAV